MPRHFCVEATFNQHITKVVLWRTVVHPKPVLRESLNIVFAMEVDPSSFELIAVEALYADIFAVEVIGACDERDQRYVYRLLA